METSGSALTALQNSLAPHSLGNPIKWKPLQCDGVQIYTSTLPTRWGTQLNGNEKPIAPQCVASNPTLPTRWGTQLNGNCPASIGLLLPNILPTRWGTQLNGNI